MPPVTIVLDQLRVQELRLTRTSPADPTEIRGTWTVSDAARVARVRRNNRELPLSAGQQTTINNLWNAIVAAISAAEGI
jgi:hypothetical protein